MSFLSQMKEMKVKVMCFWNIGELTWRLALTVSEQFVQNNNHNLNNTSCVTLVHLLHCNSKWIITEKHILDIMTELRACVGHRALPYT